MPSICQWNLVSEANQTYKRNYVLKVKASIIYELPETVKLREGGWNRERERKLMLWHAISGEAQARHEKLANVFTMPKWEILFFAPIWLYLFYMYMCLYLCLCKHTHTLTHNTWAKVFEYIVRIYANITSAVPEAIRFEGERRPREISWKQRTGTDAQLLEHTLTLTHTHTQNHTHT